MYSPPKHTEHELAGAVLEISKLMLSRFPLGECWMLDWVRDAATSMRRNFPRMIDCLISGGMSAPDPFYLPKEETHESVRARAFGCF